MNLNTSLLLLMKVKCPHLLRVHCCALSPNVKIKDWRNGSWSEDEMVVSLLSPKYHHLPKALAWAWGDKVPVLSFVCFNPDLLPSLLLGTGMAYSHPAG